MSGDRKRILLSILRGLAVSAAITLTGMLVIAGMVTFLNVSDGTLTLLNQLLKLAAIASGVLTAVGRGGHRGLITGAVLAMLYLILGYSLYVALGGGAFSAAGMLGELMMGAAAGGLIGAILANLPAASRRRR